MRVLIVAEGVAAAEAVRRSMRYAPSFRVIGFVDGRAGCSEAVERERPDVVVVDDLSAWSDALARIRDVRSAMPTSKIVLLAACVDAGRLEEAAAAGADAAIAKTGNAASVGMLIREIAAGNVYHSFTRPAPALVATNESADGLTARELEILRLVAAGMANARIAAALWVTEQTVKFHLSNVYRKLGLANRTEASHYAHVNGLIETVPARLPGATTAMEVAA